MDYGQNQQTVNSESEQVFFTTGAGVNSESVNNVNPEDNLDLTNRTAHWGEVNAVKHREIGNRAIFPTDEIAGDSADATDAERSPTTLGEIVNLEMPPSIEPLVQNQTMPADVQSSSAFMRDSIRTTEKLDPSGIKEVDRIISKLNQDGDVASFYTAARDMMEANMENSYGEKAAWKGAK